jgi:hypothetical protein
MTERVEPISEHLLYEIEEIELSYMTDSEVEEQEERHQMIELMNQVVRVGDIRRAMALAVNAES